ncbi:MAG: hypothetical protein AAGG11_18180 [Pseudomonadota bacterium]
MAQLPETLRKATVRSPFMGFTPAVSRSATDVFAAVEAVSERAYGARVLPTVAGGFTDSHCFRDLGIVSYRYSPFVVGPLEFRGVHGNNERVSVENIRTGTR